MINYCTRQKEREMYMNIWYNSKDYFGGEPTTGGEAVPGDEELSTELFLGRSASSIDIERDRRPKPAKPASIGKPDTKETNKKISFFKNKKKEGNFYYYINRFLVEKIALISLKHRAKRQD